MLILSKLTPQNGQTHSNNCGLGAYKVNKYIHVEYFIKAVLFPKWIHVGTIEDLAFVGIWRFDKNNINMVEAHSEPSKRFAKIANGKKSLSSQKMLDSVLNTSMYGVAIKQWVGGFWI